VLESGPLTKADAAEAAEERFGNSGARVAVLCSSDALYPELVPVTAGALKRAGATHVVLAGHPGEHEAAYRAAGVDMFIYIKCDVVGTLTALLRDEGVLS
jgi:methylmalonyl-CoA mutase